MLPDWLRRTEDYKGDQEAEAADPDLQAEREWLASAVRCFLSEGAEGNYKNRPQKYRQAAYWWLLMLDTFLFIRSGAGLDMV